MKDDPSGLFWDVEESLEMVSNEIQKLHFHINPSAETDLYLNYWLTQTDFRRVATDGQPNQINTFKKPLSQPKEIHDHLCASQRNSYDTQWLFGRSYSNTQIRIAISI